MKVFLSPLAELKLQLILEYLTDEFGDESKTRFLNKLKNSFETVSTFSESHPKTDKLGGIYKIVVLNKLHFFIELKMMK